MISVYSPMSPMSILIFSPSVYCVSAEDTKIIEAKRIADIVRAATRLIVPTFDMHFLFIDLPVSDYLFCQRFILPTLNPVILLSTCNLRHLVCIECHGFSSLIEISWVDIGVLFFWTIFRIFFLSVSSSFIMACRRTFCF